MAIATAVVVSDATSVKAVVTTLAMTALTKDKAVAVVAKSIYQFQLGKIQSLYGVLQMGLSSADCYRDSALANFGRNII